ncbi:hypothetical protein IJC60_02360 [bacterium]|nr:hypothetical protein [bacterium]
MVIDDKIKLEHARKFFYARDYSSAANLFDELELFYEKGFCTFLLKDEIEARRIWSAIKNPCPAVFWGLDILDIINCRYSAHPTYFQVRAFLEVYLHLLILNEHFTWAENILSGYEIFSKANYEACKFIARVLYFHHYDELTLDFIEKSKRICYPDPEALFIEAQTYLRCNNNTQALKTLNKLLEIVPEYLPALNLKNRVETTL